MACGNFAQAFQHNMSALGLPAPNSLFSTLQAATANFAAMLNAFKAVGPGATVAEMIGATTGLEVLGIIGAISASAYVGAVIGSLIVAADESMLCTSSVSATSSVHQWAARNGIHIPAEMYAYLQWHPEVMINMPSRSGYAFSAGRRFS
jgi:hypothetical protein